MNSGSPTPTEPPVTARPAGGVWRSAWVFYPLLCLLGLAAGLWPGSIYPSQAGFPTAPLPALRCLAVAQVAFVLLVYPLVLQSRRRACGEREYWSRAALESGICLVATVPFYVAAAWLGDAVTKDVVRAAVYVACLFPVAWVGGAYLARGPARSAVLLALLLSAFGLPAAYYVTREFLMRVPSEWLWRLAPATFAWDQAASRGDSWFPQPAWAWVLWPVIAAAAGMGRLLLRGASSLRRDAC
jgi:hypothetical protein